MYGFARRLPAAAGSAPRKPARAVAAVRPPGTSQQIDDRSVANTGPTAADIHGRPTSRSYAWGGLLSRLAA